MKNAKMKAIAALITLFIVSAALAGCGGAAEIVSEPENEVIVTEEIIKKGGDESEADESSGSNSQSAESRQTSKPNNNGSSSAASSDNKSSDNGGAAADETEDEQVSGRKLIAFTFDDGPNDAVPAICDKFLKYGGKATFMVIGRGFLNEKGVEYAKYAVDNGFELGNHSMNHSKNFTAMTKSEMITEVNDCDNIVSKKLGYKMTLVRLPGLTGDEKVYSAMKEIGKPLIGGDMTNDWSGTDITVDALADYMIKHAEPGKVMLMHSLQRGADALEKILPELKSQGYEFVTVSDMFKISGKKLPLGYQITKVQ